MILLLNNWNVKNISTKIIEYANEIIQSLSEGGFFNEHEIKNIDFSKNIICEKLTDKFITNGLDLEVGIFTEDEFEQMLREIIASDILNELKIKGYLNSYEDDDTEELFFLTEEGKKYLSKLERNGDL